MKLENIDKLKEIKKQLKEINSYGNISYNDRKVLIEVIDKIENIVESEEN